MATAAPPVVPGNNWVYLFRLLNLTIDEGTTLVRNIFDDKRPNVPLDVFLAQEKTAITRLRSIKKITSVQYDMLFPQSGIAPKTSDLDLTLTICLLRNIRVFGLNRHFQWNSLPQPGDISLEADLRRLQLYRNEFAHTSTTTGVNETDFKTKWGDIEKVLHRLNASVSNPVQNLQHIIDDCKTRPLDQEEQERIDEIIEKMQAREIELETDVLDVRKGYEELHKRIHDLETQKKKEETEQNNILQQESRNIPDEIENNPFYLQLYIDAISKGEEKDRVTRVNVVGNFAQGKTTLIKRLTHQIIEGVESTNSVDINHCTCKSTDDKLYFIKKEHANNEFDDTGRLVRVAHNLPIQKETQKGRKYEHDYDNGKTKEKKTKLQFKDISEETIDRTEEKNRHTDNPKPKREHNREENSSVFQDNQKKFAFQFKNKKGKDKHQNDLEIWDFGGQFSFYATHSLFHSRRAVYLLVFDLSIPLSERVKDAEFRDINDEKTLAEYAQFWLNSIHAYVGSEDGKEPPVILVGTHKDKLKGDVNNYIDKYFVEIKELFGDEITKCHIQPTYFAVDNTNENDNDIIKLRKEIVDKGEQMPTKSIPAKWIPLEKMLRMIRQTKIMKFEDLMILDSRNEFPLKEEEQVKLFLRYHHFKGTLLYFDEEPISEYILLDPQYVIDAFKCFITSKRFMTLDVWERLAKTAILENDIIDRLWNKENGFCEHKKELLMFLEKHLIISKISKCDENLQDLLDTGQYLIPSFLPRNSTEAALTSFLKDGQQTSVRFVMSFNRSPVVQHVYYRLLAALVGKWEIVQIPVAQKPVKKMKRFIYENKGVFKLDRYHAGIVEYAENEIDLRVVSLSSSIKVDSKRADELRRFSESIVKNEFMKFRNPVTQKDKPYNLCFKCNNKTHGPGGGITSETFQNIIGDKGKIPCPDLNQHEALDAAQIRSEWFLEYKIEVSFSDRQINDKELNTIVKAIGQGWRFLGLELGLTPAELDHIEEDRNNAVMKRYTMLLEWKSKEGDRATIKTLIQAMETETNVHIEWDIIRNFVDKIK